VLDAHSIPIKRTWERRINERVWKRHNAYGRRSISRIFLTMQNRTQSTNPWFNQVYPTGWSVGQANLDGPKPRQNVLERKRSFYPRLSITEIENSNVLTPDFHDRTGNRINTLHITSDEVKDIFECLQLGKAVGSDLISHCMLKNTASTICKPLFRRPIIPTTHYSDSPLLRRPIFRQCKIELNPQIHGLTRCIQQDGPSVRLILTDHGLDRMLSFSCFSRFTLFSFTPLFFNF
jgi:hypothetical protein